MHNNLSMGRNSLAAQKSEMYPKKHWYIKILLILCTSFLFLACDPDAEYLLTKQLQAPQNLAVTNITNTSAVLTWDNDARGVIYSIDVRQIGASSKEYTMLVKTLELKDLNSDSQYRISITSLSGYETSNPATISFKTEKTEPLKAPENLVVASITIKSAVLTWSDTTIGATYTINVQQTGASPKQYTTQQKTLDLQNLNSYSDYTVSITSQKSGYETSNPVTTTFKTKRFDFSTLTFAKTYNVSTSATAATLETWLNNFDITDTDAIKAIKDNPSNIEIRFFFQDRRPRIPRTGQSGWETLGSLNGSVVLQLLDGQDYSFSVDYTSPNITVTDNHGSPSINRYGATRGVEVRWKN